MIQDIGNSVYHNEYKRMRPEPESKILGYRGRELLVRQKGEEFSFLRYCDLQEHLTAESEQALVYLFSIDETSYFWLPELAADKNLFVSGMILEDEIDAAAESENAQTNVGQKEDSSQLAWKPIEWLRTAIPRTEAFAGVTGYQLADWYQSRRFCPRCGQPMAHDERERMMRCHSCGQMEYPKISPAVIVAVTNGDRLLLTKYAGGAYRKYALIAGFAEIGETIEETVAREVMEEVGLKVKNIRYYKSQPWSFSGTLLMGFFAELDGSDTIHLDETELSVGKWCTRDEIPDDDGVSLTREMMRVFKNREGE